MNNEFKVLGIERTTDKRVIKRAYASKVKQYHPEENPEEWKKVHEAYEAAMAYAMNAEAGNQEDIPESEQTLGNSYYDAELLKQKVSRTLQNETAPSLTDNPEPDDSDKTWSEESEMDENMVFFIEREKEKSAHQEQEYERARHSIEMLCAFMDNIAGDKIQSLEKWQNLMTTSEMQEYLTQPVVIRKFVLTLKEFSVDEKTRKYIWQQIIKIEKRVNMETTGEQKEIALRLIEAAKVRVNRIYIDSVDGEVYNPNAWRQELFDTVVLLMLLLIFLLVLIAIVHYGG